MIEQMRKSSQIKIELLSKGVDFEKEPNGIGQELKEEYRALFDARLPGFVDMTLPPEIVLPGLIVSKAIYRPNSPYIIESNGEEYQLRLKEKKVLISPVTFPPRPKFYREFTSRGTPMKQVGQILGLNCLGVIINSFCNRTKDNKNCKFCNIGCTTNKKEDCVRNLDEIAETASRAYSDKEFSLVNLTGGTFSDAEKEFITYCNTAKKIRGIMHTPRLAGVSSINPPLQSILNEYGQLLREANFELVTYNLEVWDKRILKRVCPGKFEIGGRDVYIKSAKETMKIIGEGHVGVIFTVGPWENVKSLLKGSSCLAKEGILPIPVVFHPGRGAEYSWMGTTSPEDLLKLYRGIYNIYEKFRLVKAGRSRPAGSELSFRNSLINEACLGYLN